VVEKKNFFFTAPGEKKVWPPLSTALYNIMLLKKNVFKIGAMNFEPGANG